MVFWFSVRVLCEAFLILRRIQRDYTVNIGTFSWRVPATVVRVWRRLNFLGRFSKNTRNIKFHENLPTGNRVVACEQMGRRDEANT